MIKSAISTGSNLAGRTWLAESFAKMLHENVPAAMTKKAFAFLENEIMIQMDTGPGFINAHFCQDGQDETVRLNCEMFSRDIIRNFLEELNRHPRLKAQLLSGNAPPALLQVLRQTGCHPAPAIIRSASADCSICGQGSWCVHSTAACLATAAEADIDPMILFEMAGIDRKMLISHDEKSTGSVKMTGLSARTLAADPVLFWKGIDENIPEPDVEPDTGKILLQRLGPLPFDHSGRNLADFLGNVFREAKNLKCQ